MWQLGCPKDIRSFPGEKTPRTREEVCNRRRNRRRWHQIAVLPNLNWVRPDEASCASFGVGGVVVDRSCPFLADRMNQFAIATIGQGSKRMMEALQQTLLGRAVVFLIQLRYC